MKVLHLSTHDIRGGAARAAYRLHQGLQTIGVTSSMLVQRRHGNDPTVLLDSRAQGMVASLLAPHIDKWPLALYRQRQRTPWGLNWTPSPTVSAARQHQPDLMQLHWIADGFLPLRSLANLKKPIVWTLHDSWAFTGGCHLPYDCVRYREQCGACPQLRSNREADLSRWHWHYKERAFRDLPLTIVTPSQWLAACARQSTLLQPFRTEVIPNGLDLTRFKPLDKAFARAAVGLPPDKKLILFGALNSTSDRNKGFHLLQPALHKLAATLGSSAAIVILGARAPVEPLDLGLPAHYTGNLQDEITMALCYAAADVFVAPSVQENLSNMVMEALACGTPSVAFRIGGMPDMIDHQQNGYLATPFDSDDLAAGMHWVLADEQRQAHLAAAARQKVVTNFEVATVARRYLALYETLLP